uniref:CUB domain-containing protein n=1 Tax=Globodera pallida TaxID=36090 RepID=A0A183C1A0_GLOPA
MFSIAPQFCHRLKDTSDSGRNGVAVQAKLLLRTILKKGRVTPTPLVSPLLDQRKADSFQPKHYVLTQWGCTDKKPAELILDTKLIAKTAAGRILTQTCSRYVGKANVSRTNAGITVPTPAKECKKAYRSKLRAYNESSDQLCGQSQRYCYVLNCSTVEGGNQPEIMTEWGCTNSLYKTADFREGKGRQLDEAYSPVEGGNQPEIMTEWGCTNSLYKTADFRQGKGRQLDEAYSVGPIPNNSVCRSYVGIFSNVGIMLPLLISTSNSSNSTLKCKRSRITSGGITDDQEECAAGDIVCYAVSCSNGTHSNNDVKEWGCTSDVAELCQQKAVQFDFEFKSCKCFYGTSEQLLTHNTAMKMKSAADLGEGSSSAINHHIDKRSLNPSSSAVSMTRSINHSQFVLVALLTSCAYQFRNVYSIV